MAKTAVFSVIFPANLEFFNQFLSSLEVQTMKDFDLLLLIDSIEDIDEHIARYKRKLNIVTHKASGTIAEVRDIGFKWICDCDYKNIVFSDSDDLMAKDRLAVCVDGLSSYQLIVNDVVPFCNKVAGTKGYWRSRMHNGHEFGPDELQNYNFVGLGNSAIRSEIISQCEIPPDLSVVDWFVFFHWMQGKRGVFSHEGSVFYRQTSDNIAGVDNITDKRLLDILQVKLRHYQALLNGFPEFRTQLERHRELYEKLRTNNLLPEAVHSLRSKGINYFWWEEPIHLL